MSKYNGPTYEIVPMVGPPKSYLIAERFQGKDRILDLTFRSPKSAQRVAAELRRAAHLATLAVNGEQTNWPNFARSWLEGSLTSEEQHPAPLRSSW